MDKGSKAPEELEEVGVDLWAEVDDEDGEGCGGVRDKMTGTFPGASGSWPTIIAAVTLK